MIRISRSPSISERKYKKINLKKIINELEFIYTDPKELCIQSLKFPNEEREDKLIKYIKSYIETIPEFLNLLEITKEKRNYNLIMRDVSINLKFNLILKDRFVYKYIGDKVNKIYILLSGKIALLTTKIISCYLNEEEYLNYLMKLRNNNEIEVLKRTIEMNLYNFEIGENFDLTIKKLYDDYMSKPINLKYSSKTYEKIIETEKNIKANSFLNNIYDEIMPELYIKSNQIENENLPFEKRTKVYIFSFEICQIYNNNEIFVVDSLNNKNKKIDQTLITLEDSKLITLDLDEYKNILIKIEENAKQQLFDLIYSHNIFMEIPKNIFETRYYPQMQYIKYDRNQKIFKEGDLLENSIFINSGQFTFSINKNLIELNDLIVKIKVIKGKINRISNENLEKTLDEKYENEELIMNEKFSIQEHYKIINERRNIILTVLKDKEIIGLNDCIDPNTNKALFTFSCISQNNDAYILPYNTFQLLISRENGVKSEVKKLINLKLDFFINRLQQYKKEILSKIKVFDTYNKEKNKSINYIHPKNNFKRIINNSFVKKEFFIKKTNKKRISTFLLPNINIKNNSFKLNNSIQKSRKNIIDEENKEKIFLKKLQKISNLKKIYKINSSRKDKINSYLEKCKNELEERNRKTFILCSYINESQKYKLLKNKEEEKSKLSISISPLKESQDNINNDNSYLRCVSSVGKITNYSYSFSPLTGKKKKINFVDPLIMDKFNNYYKKGVLKDLSTPNILSKEHI